MRIGRGGAVNSNDMNGGLFMCGIIGYTGSLDARPVIIDGLLLLNTEDMTAPEFLFLLMIIQAL